MRRFEWVDVLKGVAIIMVVVYHLAARFDAELNPEGWGVWTVFAEFFVPLRMPLFFFLSGFVVANAVGRGVSSLRKRFLAPAYLYVLWTALFSLRLVPAAQLGWVDQLSITDFLLTLVLPTTFWYIYALAVYFVTCCLTNYLPNAGKVAVGVIAVGLALWASFIPEFSRDIVGWPWGSPQVPALMLNFVWFFAGVFGRDVWDSISRRSSPKLIGFLCAGYVGLFAIQQAFGEPPMIGTILSAVGLVAVATLIPRMDTDSKVALAMSHVGRQTLPVYIFHVIFISLLLEVMARTPLAGIYASNPGWLSLITLPVTVAAMVLVALWLGRVIERSSLAFLLVPPSRLTGARSEAPVAATDGRQP